MDIEQAVFSFEYDGEDFTILLHDGIFMLRGCEWRPEGSQPEFVVIYVHGLGSFLTTKHDIIGIILESGGAFMGCDHLGHGRSPGFRSSSTLEEICEETELVIIQARESFPDLPIFLFGNSMGSLACLKLIFEKSMFAAQNLRGVIIESPWISNSTTRPISFLESIGIWLMAKFSPLSIVSTGEQYASDIRPDFVEKVMNCPLFSPFTTPRLLDSALRAITFVRKSYGDWPSDLPVLFLQGGADTMVDPVVNEAWFRDVQESSAKDTVEYKIYPGATHSLLKGPYRAEVLTDILRFINNHKQ